MKFQGKISEIGTYDELMQRKQKFFELITTFVQETKESQEATSEKPSDAKPAAQSNQKSER